MNLSATRAGRAIGVRQILRGAGIPKKTPVHSCRVCNIKCTSAQNLAMHRASRRYALRVEERRRSASESKWCGVCKRSFVTFQQKDTHFLSAKHIKALQNRH